MDNRAGISVKEIYRKIPRAISSMFPVTKVFSMAIVEVLFVSLQ